MNFNELNCTGGSPLKILWGNTIHRYNLMLVTSFWFFSSIINYIMNFYIKYIKTENIFILIILTAIAELLSKSLNGVILKYIGFKVGTLIFICMAISASICYIIFNSLVAIVPIIIFFWKFFAGATYASMYFSIPTLFQSKISVTAYNICNISAKIGAISAPMIAELPGTIPMIFLSGWGVLSLLIVAFLKVPHHEEEIRLKDSDAQNNEDWEIEDWKQSKNKVSIQ